MSMENKKFVIVVSMGDRLHAVYSRVNSPTRFWNCVDGYLRHDSYNDIGGEYALMLLSEETNTNEIDVTDAVLSFRNTLLEHNVLDIFLSGVDVSTLGKNAYISGDESFKIREII